VIVPFCGTGSESGIFVITFATVGVALGEGDELGAGVGVEVAAGAGVAAGVGAAIGARGFTGVALQRSFLPTLVQTNLCPTAPWTLPAFAHEPPLTGPAARVG